MANEDCPPIRRRARSGDQKRVIREKIIETGRRLFKDADAATVSLRRIATEAGYAPSTIYTYFPDHQALLTEIRLLDLATAADVFERVGRAVEDPIERVRAVFSAAVDYWVEHFDAFEVIYAQRQLPTSNAARAQFANSSTAQRLYAFYASVVGEVLDRHGDERIPVVVATDSIIAATHGIILITRRTVNKPWVDVRVMTSSVVDALLLRWGATSVRLTGLPADG